MTITSTNSVTTDISYTISETTGNTQNSANDSLGYSVVYTQGTGNPSVSGYTASQVNGQVKNTGVIASGGTLIIDFESIPKSTFGASYSLNFKEIKRLISLCYSRLNHDGKIFILTLETSRNEIPTGESGNYKVNPYGSFVYSNFYGDNDVSSTHRYLHFVNTSTGDNQASGNIDYSYILIGVTG